MRSRVICKNDKVQNLVIFRYLKLVIELGNFFNNQHINSGEISFLIQFLAYSDRSYKSSTDIVKNILSSSAISSFENDKRKIGQ